MYLEKGRINLAQFILNNMYKEGTIENYGVFFNEKTSEIVLFNHKNIYIVKHQLTRFYPEWNDPRINVGAGHFEIDGVEIDRNLLVKAIEWQKSRKRISSSGKKSRYMVELFYDEIK